MLTGWDICLHHTSVMYCTHHLHMPCSIHAIGIELVLVVSVMCPVQKLLGHRWLVLVQIWQVPQLALAHLLIIAKLEAAGDGLTAWGQRGAAASKVADA